MPGSSTSAADSASDTGALASPATAESATAESAPAAQQSEARAFASPQRLPATAGDQRRLETFRHRRRLTVLLSALIDAVLVQGSFVLGWLALSALPLTLGGYALSVAGHPSLGIHWPRTFGVVVTLMVWYVFHAHGLYRPVHWRLTRGQTLDALRAGAVLYAFIFLMAFLERSRFFVERLACTALAAAFGLGLLALFRGLLLPRLMRSRAWRKRAIILGVGTTAQYLARQRARLDRAGFELVGFLDDGAPQAARPSSRRRAASEGTARRVAPLPVLGTLADLASVARREQLDEAFLAVSGFDHDRLLALLSAAKDAGLELRVVSDLWTILTQKVRVDTVAGVPLVHVRETPLYGLNAFLKRAMDVALTALLLLILSPLLFVIALAVRLNSPGPVLFRQPRVGRGGRRFNIFKFRSMVAGNDSAVHQEFVTAFIRGESETELAPPELAQTRGAEAEKVRKLAHDPRITRVGRFLRRWSLDELPQLLNVLRGEMSLVGPRPPIPYEVEEYNAWHERRLDVRPGITGLWQVTSRSGVDFDDMVVLDIYYIENWSVWLDLKILLLTPAAVLSRRGAC